MIGTFASEEEYENFSQALDDAKNSLQNRESKLRDVYETLESDLELIGAIGIEDRLQENVKDTLVAMSQAGIKVHMPFESIRVKKPNFKINILSYDFFIQVWILTGDKKETAINISRSCGHLRKGMEIIDLAGIENPQTIENMMTRKLQDTVLDRSQNWCLIVDGTTLTSIFLPTNKSDTVLQQFLIFFKNS